jgi:membrane protease YdiL (CAAX protease family)
VNSPVERAAAAFEVILCSGLPTQFIIVGLMVAFGMRPGPAGSVSPRFVFTLTLLDTVVLIGLVAFFFRSHGESMRQELFGAASSVREILVGIALIPISFFIIVSVLLVVQLVAPTLRNVPHNPLADLVKTRLNAAIFAFVVMVAGGVREEIQRGFVLRRFEQSLGGGAVGLVLFSIVFGLGHLEQGRDVAVATGVLGAVWGGVFLRRRSILGPMVGHAGFDLAQVFKFVMWGA